MPYEFTLIGEHTAYDDLLLVLGADGHYYQYHPAREEFSRVEPDESWTLFSDIDIDEGIFELQG